MTSVDQEIAANRRRLTEVLCKIGQNPLTEDYEVVLTTTREGWNYQLLCNEGTTASGRAITATLCTIKIEGSHVHVSFNNSVEPVKLTWLDMRKIRKSFILGRYIMVLRPLEALFAHETAVEELSEWTTTNDE